MGSDLGKPARLAAVGGNRHEPIDALTESLRKLVESAHHHVAAVGRPRRARRIPFVETVDLPGRSAGDVEDVDVGARGVREQAQERDPLAVARPGRAEIARWCLCEAPLRPRLHVVNPEIGIAVAGSI